MSFLNNKGMIFYTLSIFVFLIFSGINLWMISENNTPVYYSQGEHRFYTFKEINEKNMRICKRNTDNRRSYFLCKTENGKITDKIPVKAVSRLIFYTPENYGAYYKDDKTGIMFFKLGTAALLGLMTFISGAAVILLSIKYKVKSRLNDFIIVGISFFFFFFALFSLGGYPIYKKGPDIIYQGKKYQNYYKSSSMLQGKDVYIIEKNGKNILNVPLSKISVIKN